MFHLYLFAILYGISFWYFPPYDPDLGWHLLGGAWITANGRVPSEDIINAFNLRWHDYHWLSQIVMYKIYQLFGYDGLRVGLGILMAYLSKVIVDIVLLQFKKRPSFLVSLVAFLCAIILINSVTAIRPQMISVLFVSLAFRRLVQPYRKWELVYLFLLSVVLVNIHVYWIFIPFLWGVMRIIPRLYRKRVVSSATAWGGLVLLLLAGLISPYGVFSSDPKVAWFDNYALIYDYMVMPEALSGTIHELKPGLHADGMIPWLLIGFLLVVLRKLQVKRVLANGNSYLIALVGFILAIRTVKFASIFGIFCLPVLVKHLVVVIKPCQEFFNNLNPILKKVGVLIVLLGAIWRCWIYSPLEYKHASNFNYYLPIEACRYIAKHSDEIPIANEHGRILTHFNYGGWCRWVIYQENPALDFRVTTDGRTQWVPPKHYSMSFALYSIHQGWFSTLKSWAPDVILVNKITSLAQVLGYLQADWKLIYQDDIFAVFLPTRKELDNN